MTRQRRPLLGIFFLLIAAGCGQGGHVEVSLDRPFAGSPDIGTLLTNHTPNAELRESPTRCVSCDDHIGTVILTSGTDTVAKYPLRTLTISEWAPDSEAHIAMIFGKLDLKSLGPLVDWFSKQPGAYVYSAARGDTKPCDANCNEPLLNAHNCSSSRLAVCVWSIAATGLLDGKRPYYAILSGTGPGKTYADLSLDYGTLP